MYRINSRDQWQLLCSVCIQIPTIPKILAARGRGKSLCPLTGIRGRGRGKKPFDADQLYADERRVQLIRVGGLFFVLEDSCVLLSWSCTPYYRTVPVYRIIVINACVREQTCISRYQFYDASTLNISACCRWSQLNCGHDQWQLCSVCVSVFCDFIFQQFRRSWLPGAGGNFYSSTKTRRSPLTRISCTRTRDTRCGWRALCCCTWASTTRNSPGGTVCARETTRWQRTCCRRKH